MREENFRDFFFEVAGAGIFRRRTHVVRRVGAHLHNQRRTQGPGFVDLAGSVQEDPRRVVFVVDMAVHAFFAVVDVKECPVHLPADGQFHRLAVFDRTRNGRRGRKAQATDGKSRGREQRESEALIGLNHDFPLMVFRPW